MILRLSQLLAKKAKVRDLSALPLAADPLTDWSAHLFNLSRDKYVIVTNTTSLYSTVLHAKGLNDAHELAFRVRRAILEAMVLDGFAEAYDQRIAIASSGERFATALNRSVTGSMNDLVRLARRMLAEDMSPKQVCLQLTKTPMFAINGPDGRPGALPIQAMRQLIDDPGAVPH